MKLLRFLFFTLSLMFFTMLLWGISTFFIYDYILTPIVSLIFLLVIPFSIYLDRKEIHKILKKDSNY
ncbi:hypothetical protein D3C87_79820 [compost metagenome]